jgi:uridine phosphorylase
MSIIKSFDPAGEEVLRAGHFCEPIEGFPETVLVTFTRYMLNTILQHYTCVTIGKMPDGRTIYETTYKNKPIAFFRTSIGAPPTVALLEEAIVCGAKKFLLFGSCGTLDGSITDGNIVVPTHAYRDEGISYHYAPADAGEYIEVKTCARTAEILKDIGVNVVLGKTLTTDAIYRETRANMELRKKDGCITVEMECAGVMAMAQFRGIEAYQYLYTADNLDADEWQRRSLGSLPSDTKERFVKMALEVVVRL